MSYSLSVVLLIPAAHRVALNAIAEGMGWGPDNMSVSLSNGTWYGCHAMAAPGFLDEFAAAPEEAAPVLVALVMSVADPDAPQADPDNPVPVLMGKAHWDAVLLANNLTVDEVTP